jgi:hypothetical protein
LTILTLIILDISHAQELSKERQEKFRKISMEFQTLPGERRKGSSGERTTPERRVSMVDLINMYRHRRSVTDTYLGTELDDSDSDSNDRCVGCHFDVDIGLFVKAGDAIGLVHINQIIMGL